MARHLLHLRYHAPGGSPLIRLDKPRIRQDEKRIQLMRPEDFAGLPDKYRSFEAAYAGYHSRRFATLLQLLEQLGVTEATTILDVGPTFTAMLFNQELKCRVDGLSFSEDEATPFGNNYQFDLNQSEHESKRRRDFGPYPVVVFAEVIEHLYVAPKHVLHYLGELTEPGGHIICQTPNPLALRKRIQLLLGKHPYDELSECYLSPDHIREHTLKELISYGHRAGLEIAFAGHFNYFNPTFRQRNKRIPSWVGKLFFRFNDWLPGPLKPNCMVIYRRPKSG